MRHIKTYKIFEAGAHWKDDIIAKIKWDRKDELLDLLCDFPDVGWIIPTKNEILVDICDDSFNGVSKKIDMLERTFYQTYTIRIRKDNSAKLDLEFFKEVVELLTKLRGYNFKYHIYNDNFNLLIKAYNEEDVVDPKLVIADMKKAKTKAGMVTKFGIDRVMDVLKKHESIMDIKKVNNTIEITTKVEKYDIDSIFEIVYKMFGSRSQYHVILKGNTVIVRSKGRWI